MRMIIIYIDKTECQALCRGPGATPHGVFVYKAFNGMSFTQSALYLMVDFGGRIRPFMPRLL